MCNGTPLILLHGGAGATEMWAQVTPQLSRVRKAVAADLQAHGRTADIDRSLRYATMADDVYGLVEFLQLGKVDLMGYSLGGVVALRTAIQHPNIVRKLILVSTPFERNGWYPEVRDAMAHGADNVEPMKQTPIHEMYYRIAPRPKDFPVLFR